MSTASIRVYKNKANRCYYYLIYVQNVPWRRFKQVFRRVAHQERYPCVPVIFFRLISSFILFLFDNKIKKIILQRACIQRWPKVLMPNAKLNWKRIKIVSHNFRLYLFGLKVQIQLNVTLFTKQPLKRKDFGTYKTIKFLYKLYLTLNLLT